MRIIIKSSHPANRGNRSAELDLPGRKAEILEALDKARIPYGSGEYQLAYHRDSPEFVKKMLGSFSYNPSIAEMNHLAQRMVEIDEDERHKLDGILKIRDSYDITDAINATHNLHGFEFYPGVTNDYTLGEFAIDGDDGIYPPLGQVPEELLACLDREKVGALVRRHEGAVFTDCGYVVPGCGDWDAVYDGQSLSGRAVTLEPGDPIISLWFNYDNMQADVEYGVRLDLPASEADMKAALEKLGTDSFDECDWLSIESVIPAFESGFSIEHTTVDGFNELAGMIRTNGGAELAKYKAALAYEGGNDIQTAMCVAGRLDEYQFERLASTEELGRTAMEKTGADVKLMDKYGFDFDGYGSRIMQEQDVSYTAYGFISRHREQEQAMSMTEPLVAGPEMDDPAEPTMTM